MTVRATDEVAVELKGLPFQITFKQIEDFFKGHDYYPRSVIVGRGPDGYRNGNAIILF